jgi:hypothetical protein
MIMRDDTRGWGRGTAWVRIAVRDRARLLFGSLGLGLALSGLVLFLGQMYRAIENGRLETIPVRVVLDEPFIRHTIIPRLAGCFRWLSVNPELPESVGWFIDQTPLALFLAVIGGLLVWRNLLAESRPSHRR